MQNIAYPDKIISYVVASDVGLAPNITDGYATLTVCKPVIRRMVEPHNTWVLGLSTSSHGMYKVVHVMIPEEKISYDAMWNDKRFQNKKPDIQKFGDNFFENKNGILTIHPQAIHAGSTKKAKSKQKRDLNAPCSVVAKNFWYFGGDGPEVPKDLRTYDLVVEKGTRKDFEQGIIKKFAGRRGHRNTTDPKIIQDFVDWMYNKGDYGIHGMPRDLPIEKMDEFQKQQFLKHIII